MTLYDKITRVKALSDETDDEKIFAFLTHAGQELYHIGDPFHTMTEEQFIERYEDVQIDAAAYKLNKRGWDYAKIYTENGVRREYESGDLPSSILNRITPICGAVS